MKKFIAIFSIFLFISFSMNSITPVAQGQPKAFTQGFYRVKDANLLVGTSYTVQNTSPTERAFMMIVDTNQQILELIRFEPSSVKYCVRPLAYDDTLIIFGDGTLTFS